MKKCILKTEDVCFNSDGQKVGVWGTKILEERVGVTRVFYVKISGFRNGVYTFTDKDPLVALELALTFATNFKIMTQEKQNLTFLTID